MSDYISRADAIEAVAQQWLFEASVGNPYVNDDDIGEYRKLAEELFEDVPSADAVDCTDFIEWLVEVVMDDEDWELNAVAYGEIICRKLVKLGVLEVTEEPSYYIRPTEESYLNAFYDGFNTATLALSAEAVQGEWKIDEYGIYHCPFCHAINNSVYKSFCPNCGARMYKGGDDE